MSLIRCVCPHCGNEIETHAQYQGHEVQCPSCNQSVIIPTKVAIPAPEKSWKSSLKWLREGLAIIVAGILVYIIASAPNKQEDGEASLLETTPESPKIGLTLERAGDNQIRRIQEALGEERQILESAAIRSQSHKLAYFVGAKFAVKGKADQVGVWILSGNKAEPGLMYSVDDHAFKFSGMGKAERTKVKANAHNPECRRLRSHLD